MAEWRDIATAPRDGPILIWDPRGQSARVAFLGTAIEDGSKAWVYARSTHPTDPTQSISFVVTGASHWMPLPPPPVGSGDEPA